MALALYRKYRPRTFAEVIGQEHVTEPLMQALRSGRLNHAYLFSGPRGCGKTSSARILARSLNCEKGPTPEPCGVCDSCIALAPDGSGSLDVIEIDAASHGGVDDARDLRERAFFAPAVSRFKVYIIDEAHMISSQGFNALLKLVEEPPEYIKFVFATTEPEKVLGTIRSRTHHYPFRLIPPGVLRPYLEQLCRQEEVEVEPAVFPLVVRAGGGSARDSLSVLDQLIAGAGPQGVRYAHAIALLGVTDVALIDEVCDALAAGDGAAVFATIDRVAEAGHDPRRFAGDLLERLRDLIVFQQVPDAAEKGLLDVPADQLGRMQAQAQRFGPATLSRMADLVHTGLTEMRGTTAPRLLLELICARMLLPGAEDSSAALLHRLERMERRLTATGDAPPAPVRTAPDAPLPAGTSDAPPPVRMPGAPSPVRASTDAPPARPVSATPDEPPAPAGSEPIRAARLARDADAPAAAQVAPAPPSAVTGAPAASVPGVVDAAAVRRVWEEILGYVRRRSQRAAAVVREAVVRDVDGDTVVLTFKHQFHAESLTASPELVEEAIYEVLGGRWRVRAEWAGTAAGPAAPRRAAPPREQPAARSGREPASGSSRQRPSAPAADDADEEDDWPAIARLGGAAADSANPPAVPRDAPVAGMPGGPAPAGSASGGPVVNGRPPAAPAGAPESGGTAGSGSNAVSGNAVSGNAVSGGEVPGSAVPGGEVPGSELPGGGAVPGGGAASASAGGRIAPQRSGPGVSTGGAPTDPAGRPGGGRQPAGAGGSRGAAGRPEGARRAAAAAAAARGGRPGQRGTAGRAPADSGWSDAPPPDEPPFDPDYDRPVADRFDGFDPGDEPLDDDGDPQTVRESSEEQALRLLREALGAERID